MHRLVIARLLPTVTAVLCAATVSIPGWAKSAHREPTAVTTPASHRLHTATTTEAAHRGPQRAAATRGGAERWNITVTRADETVLEGHVTRVGSTSLQGGRLRGTIAGRRVTGSVTDAAGALVATFVGTITRSGGIHGSYHDRSGAVGRWSWDGPLLR